MIIKDRSRSILSIYAVSFTLFAAISVLLPSIVSAASMSDYCVVPPYVRPTASPNVLLMIDNSASQYDLAYIAGTMSGTTVPTFTCGNMTTSESFCFDDTYDDTKTYYGYFQSLDSNGNRVNTTYQYQYSGSYAFNAIPGTGGDYFVTTGGAVPTSGCYAGNGTGYFCVQVDNLTTPHYVTGFYATGNFLNWLAASKFDVQKKVLTGGKYDTTNQLLIGETRGCNGRRFMKVVKNASTGAYWPVTFGVRGPDAGEQDYLNTVTQGGLSRIEIYLQVLTPSQITACQCAVAEWTSGNYGQAHTDSGTCLGVGNVRINAFNQIMQDCWQIKQNIAGCASPYTASCIFQGVNINSDETQCGLVYSDILNTTGSYSTCAAYLAQGNDSGGAWQCSSCAQHNLPLGAYATLGSDYTGFLGLCVNMPSGSHCSNDVTIACSHDNACRTVSCTTDADCPGSTCLNSGKCGYSCIAGSTSITWNNSCVQEEVLHYCYGNQFAEVIDPSSSGASTTTTGNIPSIIMDSSTSQLAKICSNSTSTSCNTDSNCPTGGRCVPAGTFFARVSYASPGPTGKIQEFQNVINFGAMAFNQDGSASECGVTNSNISCTNTCSRTNTECLVTTDCNWCSLNPLIHCSATADCGTSGSCVSTTDGGAAETCGTATVKTDGGRVFSYINSDPIGDHTTGLISSIDNLTATSWTPFAEAFYSSIGYFAKMDSYAGTNPPPLGTSRSDMQLNTSLSNTYYNYATNKNPSQYPCQDNDVLIITDGMSTADQAAPSTSSGGVSPDNLAALYSANYGGTNGYGYDTTNSCPSYAGSRDLPGLAWIAQNKVISDPNLLTGTAADWAGNSNASHINTLVVYSGPPTPTTNPQPGLCDPYTLMNTTAQYGGTGGAILASDPTEIGSAITTALTRVISRAAAGTAASVLASGSGSGANLVQAVYYPSKIFTDQTGAKSRIGWAGRISNLWYYSDAFFRKNAAGQLLSSIYEADNPSNTASTKIFDTGSDAAINLVYINTPNSTQHLPGQSPPLTAQQTYACYAPNYTTCIPFEQVNVLWEAGKNLWSRTASDRNIFTPCLSGATCLTATNTLMNFNYNTAGALDAGNVGVLIPYLQASTTDSGQEATNIIKFTRGEDVTGYRPRDYFDGTSTHVWKLGDIINSTPKIASSVPLNTYDSTYGDTSYTNYTCSSCIAAGTCTSTNCPSGYYNRGMVFAGANDGMLHAFYFGKLQVSGLPSGTLASLTDAMNNDGTGFGKEVWSFIPENVLPYLKYMADTNYCHVYAVDMTSEVVDVSVGAPSAGDISTQSTKGTDSTVWRTYVIGGMRYGGACKNSTDTCTTGTNGTCVKTPISNVGYSSYFALDVTDSLANPGDPVNHPPVLMWEFSDPTLGFSSSGPSIVREGDGSTNGKWYVVFGSGPTGPIDDNSAQFLGKSDQSLKLFAFDLKGGPASAMAPLTVIAPATTGDTIDDAFAGPMPLSTVDVPDPSTGIPDYRDDVVYVPYTRECALGDSSAPCKIGTWTNGGIVRIITKDSTNLSNWKWSRVIDNVGPVTTSVAKLLKKKLCFVTVGGTDYEGCLWLFGGTGRFFYKRTVSGSVDMDDATTQRELFGIKEPCYHALQNGGVMPDNSDCTAKAGIDSAYTNVGASALSDTTANTDTVNGWSILLDNASSSFGAERVVTNTVASGQGVVFFTTFEPYTGQCDLGGQSYMWAVQYNTGGTPAAAALRGEALLQLSTGAITKVDLSTAFTAQGGRKTTSSTTPMEGLGGGAPTVLGAPLATKRVVHIKER